VHPRAAIARAREQALPLGRTHVHILGGRAVALKRAQRALQQQLGHQVVEAAHDDAELHVRLGRQGAVQLAGGLEGAGGRDGAAAANGRRAARRACGEKAQAERGDGGR
jgi:hypothetical protein